MAIIEVGKVLYYDGEALGTQLGELDYPPRLQQPKVLPPLCWVILLEPHVR